MNTSIARSRCFVIQPFGLKKEVNTGIYTDNDLVYNALKKLEKIDPKFPIELVRGDTLPLGDDNLKLHVAAGIANSDFCIADITGNNPNVLYEVGYADGQGIKIIIICQNLDDVPTDLKGLIIVNYETSNIDNLASDVQQHLDRVKKSVFDRSKERESNRLPTIPYLSKRNDDLIREKISSSKTRIDILQTNLSILQNDFIDDVGKALDANEHLELRVLTLDPQSVFVNYRAGQLEDTEISIFRTELQNALDAVYYRLKKYGRRVHIKIYDDFPSQIAFFFDQEILSCVVSAMGRSRDNCAFFLSSAMPGAQRSFVDHFSLLWNHRSDSYKELGRVKDEENILAEVDT